MGRCGWGGWSVWGGCMEWVVLNTNPLPLRIFGGVYKIFLDSLTFDKFSLYYLSEQTAVIPRVLVTKFGYLVQRNIPGMKFGNESPQMQSSELGTCTDRIAAQIYLSENFQSFQYLSVG